MVFSYQFILTTFGVHIQHFLSHNHNRFEKKLKKTHKKTLYPIFDFVYINYNLHRGGFVFVCLFVSRITQNLLNHFHEFCGGPRKNPLNFGVLPDQRADPGSFSFFVSFCKIWEIGPFWCRFKLANLNVVSNVGPAAQGVCALTVWP